MDVYQLWAAGGMAAAAIWLAWAGPRRGWRAGHLGWGILWVTVVALLIGRAGFVAREAAYFRQNPSQVVRLRRAAGIQAEAAWIGGLAAVGMWLRWRRGSIQRLWPLLGLLTPGALLVAAGAWWACRGAGCASGIAAPADGGVRWLIAHGPNLYHEVVPRYAVQTLGALLALAAAALGWWWGADGAAALAVYFAGTALLTLLRGDPMALVAGLRVDWLAQLTLALGIAVYGTATRAAQRRRGHEALALDR